MRRLFTILGLCLGLTLPVWGQQQKPINNGKFADFQQRRIRITNFYGPTWALNPATRILTNTPIPGTDLLTNGNMETGNPPANWTSYNAGTLTGEADDAGGGVQCLQVARSTFNNPRAYQDVTTIAGAFYRLTAYGKKGTGGGTGLIIGDTANNTISGSTSNTLTDWTLQSCTGMAPATIRVFLWSITSSGTTYNRFDNATLKLLPTASTFYSRNFGYFTNVTAKVAIVNATILYSYQGGTVICLDSQSNPQNYFLAYYGGDSKVYAYKVVGGVPTAIITPGTVTYTQGNKISIVKDATTVKVYYDNGGLTAQIGSTYTIQAGDPSGTIHGYFATDASVQVDAGNSSFGGS